ARSGPAGGTARSPGDELMHTFTFISSAAALGAVVFATASAQGLDPELTMRPIVSEAVELPAPVSEILALPEIAASIAEERSAGGLERANEVRARARPRPPSRAGAGRDLGLATAADARSRGAELGAEMAESARAMRESVVRGGGPVALAIPPELPKLPDHVPSRAGPPDPPSGPQTP